MRSATWHSPRRWPARWAEVVGLDMGWTGRQAVAAQEPRNRYPRKSRGVAAGTASLTTRHTDPPDAKGCAMSPSVSEFLRGELHAAAVRIQRTATRVFGGQSVAAWNVALPKWSCE